MDRFRPNITVSGAVAWEEDCWRRIRIGDIVFRVAKPCARCFVTTVDQLTGTRPDKSEPLRTLARIRRTAAGVMFGQNLIPDGPGRIAVGDAIEILEVEESNVPLLAAAGSLASKKQVAVSAGTFPTHGPLFVGLLVGVVIIVGALTFFPALSLGPIVERLMV